MEGTGSGGVAITPTHACSAYRLPYAWGRCIIGTTWLLVANDRLRGHSVYRSDHRFSV